MKWVRSSVGHDGDSRYVFPHPEISGWGFIFSGFDKIARYRILIPSSNQQKHQPVVEEVYVTGDDSRCSGGAPCTGTVSREYVRIGCSSRTHEVHTAVSNRRFCGCHSATSNSSRQAPAAPSRLRARRAVERRPMKTTKPSRCKAARECMDILFSDRTSHDEKEAARRSAMAHMVDDSTG